MASVVGIKGDLAPGVASNTLYLNSMAIMYQL
jgi:hypothetical protein